MKIAIGSDHAGYEYKSYLVRKLKKQGHDVLDLGPDSENSVDYPDYAHPVSDTIEQGRATLGILLCGSGNGVCMAANKHKNIRAALCWTPELAKLARNHNNANIVCIPARFVSKIIAGRIAESFLISPFEGGRHQARVDKIAKC